MIQYDSLADVFSRCAMEIQKGITFINGQDDETFISYKDLYDTALEYLNCFQSYGMGKGEILVFQIEDNMTFVCAFWACILGGIIPVPVSVGHNDESRMKLFNILKLFSNPYLIVDRKTFGTLKLFSESNRFGAVFEKATGKILFIDKVEAGTSAGKIEQVYSSDTALIQFSSGSTGNPKGVVLTHENILANIDAIAKRIRLDSYDTSLSWMPLTHDMGLIGLHITTVYKGVKQFIMPTSLFIRHPVLWMMKASWHKATILSSPNFGYCYFMDNFKRESAGNLDLRNVRLIFNGAEPISAQVIGSFADLLAPYGLGRDTIYNVYGLAEASIAVTLPPLGEKTVTVNADRRFLGIGQTVRMTDDESSRNTVQFVDVGYPVDNCRVAVFDRDGCHVGDNVVGLIHIKGKNVTSGYYNTPEADNEVTTPDGWLNTGDLGFIRNGRLVVTGREKDIIFLNGQNLYPHDIERVAAETGDVSTGQVVAGSAYSNRLKTENIILYVAFKKGLPEFVLLAAKLKRHIQERMDVVITDVVPIRRIPKTTSGKAQRYILNERYMRGEYEDVLERMDILGEELYQSSPELQYISDTERKLLKICRDILGNDEIGIKDNLVDSGTSSMIVAQIHEKLEKYYPGRVSVSDFFSHPSIEDMAAILDYREKSLPVGVKMPSEYFACDTGSSGEKNLVFVPENKAFEAIKTISQHERTEPVDIFLSIYAFLFSEITDEKKITVHTVTEIRDKAVPLEIDFSSINDLSGLFQFVREKRRQTDYPDSYSICCERKDISCKNAGTVVPVFLKQHPEDKNIQLLNIYDIVMTLEECEDSCCIKIRFDKNRLNTEKMQEFINGYSTMINLLVEKYFSKSEIITQV